MLGTISRMVTKLDLAPDEQRRVMIVAGGTGGHVAPALAVGDFMRSHYGEKVVVRYVSGSRAIERKAFDAADEFPESLMCDQPPALSLNGIPGLVKYCGSVIESRKLLKSFQPHAVLAMGGYVCAPMLIAAWTMRIPYYLHESNAIPGRVTRSFANAAQCVFVAHDEAAAALGGGAVCQTVGTPVRRALQQVSRDEALAFYGVNGEAPVMLVVGGSQGARVVNETILETLPLLGARLQNEKKLQVIWACGPINHQTVKRSLEQATPPGIDVKLFDYIDRMDLAYAASDLVVSRAGASTLAEIAALGMPSILIPYPYAKDNHQEANARALVREGAAEMILERELTANRLALMINAILASPEKQDELSQAAHRLAPWKSAELIASGLMNLPRQDNPEPVSGRAA